MSEPNQHGVYPPETVEILAQIGRAYAAVEISQCTDGLYRFSLHCNWSYGGFGGPITDHDEGYTSISSAIDAGTEELLKKFPQAGITDPKYVHDELQKLQALIVQRHSQPSLF